MWHLMPERHLPEWREEDERAFVHRGSWTSSKGLDNTMSTTVKCNLQEVTIKWWMTLWKALWQTQLNVIAWFRPELPQCTNAHLSSSLHSGRCRSGIKWHMPLLSWVTWFPCVWRGLIFWCPLRIALSKCVRTWCNSTLHTKTTSHAYEFWNLSVF